MELEYENTRAGPIAHIKSNFKATCQGVTFPASIFFPM